MPEYCTCGVQLVEGARFCHKCGRPVREEDRLAEEASAAAIVAAAVRQHANRVANGAASSDGSSQDEETEFRPQMPESDSPPPLPTGAQAGGSGTAPEIGFQNKVAVRIGALLAGPMYFLINFLAMLPGGFLLVFVGLFASGFLSVAMYRQRTGSPISIISGARLGWICGVFVFLIALVLLTVVSAIAASGDLTQVMQEQLKRQGQNAAEVQRVVEFLSNPAALLVLLATFFVMITTVPSLGGALGAKMLEPKQR